MNYFLNHLLSIIIILPLLSALLILFFVSSYNRYYLKVISFNFSLITFFISLFLFIFFNKSILHYQFIQKYDWLPNYNINFIIGIDSISLFFILLVTFLIPLCILSSFYVINFKYKEFLILFFFLEFFLIIIFCILDLFLFYIFFESILIPMFLIIGIWGAKKKKIRSNYMLFLYTLLGSLFMLIGIIYLHIYYGQTDFESIALNKYSFKEQQLLWIAFFLAFAIKVPMTPFHIWLPEAHVDAPTAGSVILAGLLLKLGTYGFFRISFLFLPIGSLFFIPFISMLCFLSMAFTSITALRQTDLKKIIAYASIAHMNFVIIGLFTFNLYSVEGSLFQMIIHGLVSSGLFLSIGIIYDRYHIKLIDNLGGLSFIMPIFSICFFLLILGNIAFPGTGSFISEFLIFIGLFQTNIILVFLSAIAIIFGTIYSLWLYNRIMFGSLAQLHIYYYRDITLRELYVLTPLILLTFVLGIFPNIFLSYTFFNIHTYLILLF